MSAQIIQAKPRYRLSLIRVIFVITVLAGCVYWGNMSFATWQATEFAASTYEPWFASYVDVTLTPYYNFEKRSQIEEADDFVLAFIVSAHNEPCTPTWGGYYTLDEAANVMDLDRRIARLQQQGGRIAVSFGGAFNSELAVQCEDPQALMEAYRSVIDHYDINTIDLDLEADGLTNAEAGKRRADVIALLQDQYRKDSKPLAVWVTLPVAPHGLTKEGTDAVTTLLSAGVDLAGVNIMTMDYGGSKAEEDSMYEASRKALIETHRQLGILYAEQGINLESPTLWGKLGATPMIGQNDIIGEIFSVEDAVALNQFATERGVGRMSMWSANRDIACGENYVDLKVVSNLCSGVDAVPFAFAQALSRGFAGDLMQNANLVTIEDPESNEHIVDDPATSPYQVWSEHGVYLKGTKVVWHGNVYEAKWWTKNDLPDNPVLQSAETPWQLIGPVLPTDKPVVLLTLPDGTYPAWNGQVIYDLGDRVIFDGMPYEAKWWNQGESPAAAAINPDSSPWLLLTQEQIAAIREARGL